MATTFTPPKQLDASELVFKPIATNYAGLVSSTLAGFGDSKDTFDADLAHTNAQQPGVQTMIDSLAPMAAAASSANDSLAAYDGGVAQALTDAQNATKKSLAAFEQVIPTAPPAASPPAPFTPPPPSGGPFVPGGAGGQSSAPDQQNRPPHVPRDLEAIEPPSLDLFSGAALFPFTPPSVPTPAPGIGSTPKAPAAGASVPPTAAGPGVAAPAQPVQARFPGTPRAGSSR